MLINKRAFIITIVAIVFVYVWLRIFRLTYKNTKIRNKIAMYISSHSSIPVSYSYSIFATLFYSGMPLIGSYILLVLFDVHLNKILTQHYYDISFLSAVVMGELAVLSCSSLPIVLLLTAKPNIRVDKEIKEINWISGIFKIPSKLCSLIPCISACCEEFFFRGALFSALMSTNISIWSAMFIVSALFVYNQIILTNTKTQAYVLGSSSMIISVIGCLLVGLTGSVIPSMIIHASFACFYSNL